MATYKKLKEKGVDEKLAMEAAEKCEGDMDKAMAFVQQNIQNNTKTTNNTVINIQNHYHGSDKKESENKAIEGPQNDEQYVMKLRKNKDGTIDQRTKEYKEMEKMIMKKQKKKLTEVVLKNAADIKLKKDGTVDKRTKVAKKIMKENENKAKNKNKNKKPKK